MTLVGLCCPYDQPIRRYEPSIGWFTLTMARGAFRAALRHSPPVWLRHESSARVADTCALFEQASGLYVRIDVPAATQIAVMQYARWIGGHGGRMRASLRLADEGLVQHWSASPARVLTITQARILEVSLIASPAFTTTWLAVDGPEAHRRIEREEARQHEIDELKDIAC